MIRIVDKSLCCGCGACVQVCPRQCITMCPDGLGFLYPSIDESKCVECGLCEKVCTFYPSYDKSANLSVPMVYAVRHKDMGQIETSRSGAAFIALSDWILERGGAVYGAGYTGHFRVVHKRAVTGEQRDEFKGSKYVQSDLNNVFIQIKKDLKRGLHVLFSGTPCQTSALRSYLSLLRVDVTLLYVIDIVCHGVPSPYFWRDYLAYVEGKRGAEAIAVNFRDKSKLGWTAHQESFTFENGVLFSGTYTYMFCQCIMFRHSCGVCPFTNLQRPSDITIADFWGWEKVDFQFNADDKGVSLVLVNSDKGRDLFGSIKNSVNYVKTDTQYCMQPNLQHPSIIHSQREDFERDYIKHGFIYVAKKYADMGWRYKFWTLKKKGRTFIKLLLKR